LFTFSSPQTAWKRKNREKFRSARLFAKIRGVFARPRPGAAFCSPAGDTHGNLLALDAATGALLKRIDAGGR
jgi:hypothetical protein